RAGNPLGLEQFFNRLAFGQDGDRPAGVVEILLLGIDAEMLIHRGKHILRRLGIALGESALGVGLADHATALDRAAGQYSAEDIGIVIAAGVVVDARRPA